MDYWSGFKDTTGSDCDVVISACQEEFENVYMSLGVLHNKEEADLAVILSVCMYIYTHTHIKIRGKIKWGKGMLFL